MLGLVRGIFGFLGASNRKKKISLPMITQVPGLASQPSVTISQIVRMRKTLAGHMD